RPRSRPAGRRSSATTALASGASPRRPTSWPSSSAGSATRPEGGRLVEHAAVDAPVVEEERELHAADGSAEAPGLAPEAGEVLQPVLAVEALAPRVALHGARAEEQLPDPDVEDAVTPGIDERQDGGGGRHPDAVESAQRLEPLPLVGSPQGEPGDAADRPRAIPLALRRGARALPAAHGQELGPPELARLLDPAQRLDERGGLRLLLGHVPAVEEP